MMSNKSVKQPKTEKLWLEGLKTLGLSLFLAFGFRAGIAQSFFIPSGSMEPTLKVGDRLMVDKVSYRFSKPERGNIIVFLPPKAAITECGLPSNSHDFFIKRLIGLPGEKIEVKGGSVYVNNHPLSENYIADKPQYHWGPVTVPPSSYLVLGDHRNNSCDSHYWGFVTGDRIVGRAFFRFWPVNRVNTISEGQKSSNIQTK